MFGTFNILPNIEVAVVVFSVIFATLPDALAPRRGSNVSQAGPELDDADGRKADTHLKRTQMPYYSILNNHGICAVGLP